MAGPQGELVFAPLGGVGEIGMNLSIYGLGDARRRTWLIVDVGVSFAQEENLPGIDLVLPDIRYLVEERRNLAGILIEGEGATVIIGIGVNCVHHPDGTEYPATDLAAAGLRATPDSLFAPLSAAMMARLKQWDRGAGFAAIRTDWLARVAGVGKPARVKTADGELAGLFEGMDASGRLVLRLPDGTMRAVAAGDVHITAR